MNKEFVFSLKKRNVQKVCTWMCKMSNPYQTHTKLM